MAAPWSAEAVRQAYGPPQADDAADSPAEGERRFDGRPYGLDLADQPRWVASTGAPPPPDLPPRAPGPWPSWAPAWLELPLPRRQPLDYWYFEPEGDVPALWFRATWRWNGNARRLDPHAIALLWCDGDNVRRPWADDT